MRALRYTTFKLGELEALLRSMKSSVVTVPPDAEAGLFSEVSSLRPENGEVMAPVPPPRFLDEEGMKVRPSEAIADRVEKAGLLPPLPSPAVEQVKANRLNDLADALQVEIDHRRNSHRNANLTRKRMQEQESAFKEADRLEKVQVLLRGLAAGHADPNHSVPAYLAGLKTKAQAELLVRIARRKEEQVGRPGDANPYGNATGWISEWAGFERETAGGDKKRLTDMGIWDQDAFSLARQWVYDLLHGREDSEAKKTALLIHREKELAMQDIPGFFPTPPDVVAQILHYARLHTDGLIVLEPSAGSGAIADAVREFFRVENYTQAKLECCEVNWSLRDLLKDKGHTVIHDNCMGLADGEGYDRVLMNPPFESLTDIAHVHQMFETQLAPGGRLVSVMSTSFQHSQRADAHAFRAWLEDHGGEVYPLGDAFKASLRSTGVQTVLVVIDKEG